jgi:hypothetical protein
MSLGKVLLLASAVLLFLAGVGFTVIPNPLVWALFCLVLALLIEGLDLRWRWRWR